MLADWIREAGTGPLAVHVLVASIAGFALMGRDKRAARRGRWRIPEKTLFLAALLGGSPGVWLGMRLFRHKTRHPSFRYGVPAILIGQLVLFGWALSG